MIGLDGTTEANVAARLLERTRSDGDRSRLDAGCALSPSHVFTLHAELEGMKLAPVLEKLLEGWKAQGYELVALRDLVAATESSTLPLHTVVDAPVPGRSGTLSCQGPVFLAEQAAQ